MKNTIKKLTAITQKTTQQLNNFKIGLAAETLHHEFWHWFCDECIEKSKKGQISRQALIRGLVTFLNSSTPLFLL